MQQLTKVSLESRVLKYFPLFKYGWAAVILYLTLAPDDGVSRFEFLKWPGVDKAGHFVMFFVWSLLQFPQVFFHAKLPGPSLRKYSWVATNSLVLGLLIELVQVYVPGRSGDALDLLADSIGTAVAIAVAHFVQQRKSGLK